MHVSGLKRYPADVARAFGHGPVEVACAMLVAAGFSWAVEIGQPEAFQAWWELVLVVLLAGAAAWTGTILHALGDWSAARRWALSLLGALVAVAVGVVFLRMEREAEVWRAATLVVAGLLIVMAAPALGRGRDEARVRFRRINGRFALRCLGAALYAGALFAGLALAIAAVDSLFELEMEGEIYGHVFGWIAFAGVPWIVVGGLPDLVRPMAERGETMALAHRVMAWLVLPLVALYYVILYSYAVRILVLDELPQNLVSPLVLAAGVLAAVALVIFDRGAVGELGDRALRLVPALFLPLAPLGAYAVAVRVGQYGWTEFRYLRIAALVGLSLVALGAVLQVARKRPLSLHLAPVVMAVVLVLSVVGPWSAMALSRHSQTGRLIDGLEAAGLLRDGRVVVDTAGPPRELPADEYDQITSTSQYLVRHFGRDAVSPPLPEGVPLEEPEARSLPAVLGVTRAGPEGLRMARGASLSSGTAVSAGRLSLMRVGLQGGRPAFDGGARLRDSSVVAVRMDAETFQADVAPLMVWLIRQDEGAPDARIPAERASVPLTDSRGRERGYLVVFELRLGEGGDGLPVTGIEAVAVIEREQLIQEDP